MKKQNKVIATLFASTFITFGSNLSFDYSKNNQNNNVSLPHVQIGNRADAGITDIQEKFWKGVSFFNKFNLAKSVLECGYQYYNNSGFCERNPNLVYYGYDKVFANQQIPCTEGYQERQALIFARKNNLKYHFWTPANKTFTFEKR